MLPASPPEISISPSHRNTIDQEVYKWVVQQNKKKKLVTPNAIRQKAYEIGQEFDPNFKASLNWYNNWKKRFDYNESPEAEALKHKKRSYTAAFKLHAVQRAMELESASQASLELDVSRRCLQRWKDELDLITTVAEQSSNAVYRRPGQGRKVADINLDAQLVDWLKECWRQGTSVSSGMIREKAREISGRPDFKASLGWYVKWQKRHCIDLKQQTCGVSGKETQALKLRLLPEGEMSSYSTPKRKPPKHIKKRRNLNDDEILLENDEEFDRLLLTWLVERWEAGDIVNDRMLKEKAMELTANADFKASKAWLSAWKRKYNVSLENQTYGNEGEEENEEIVEESEVYDNEVVIDEHHQGVRGHLTPTKEEAATALASLSAEDHEATGLEIAEALQKLASAFGIATQVGSDGSKEAMAQLTAAYHADSSDFLLDQTGQVAVEEVISEEVITDEPMVVIETAEGIQAAVTTSNTVVLSSSNSVSQATLSSQQQASADALTLTSATPSSVLSPNTAAAVPVTSSATISTAVVPTGTNSLSSYISEEVVISEPVIQVVDPEAPIDAQVEVVMQGGDEYVVYSSSQGSAAGTETIIQANPISSVQPTSEEAAVSMSLSQQAIQPATHITSLPSSSSSSHLPNPTVTPAIQLDAAAIIKAMELQLQAKGNATSLVTAAGISDNSQSTTMLPSQAYSVDVSSDPSNSGLALQQTLEQVQQALASSLVEGGEAAVLKHSLEQGVLAQVQQALASSLVEGAEAAVGFVEGGGGGGGGGDLSQEAMDVDITSSDVGTGGVGGIYSSSSFSVPVESISSSVGASTTVTTAASPSKRMFNDDFKAKVVSRAQELGSVQQAAREFSLPWRSVATWNTQEQEAPTTTTITTSTSSAAVNIEEEQGGGEEEEDGGCGGQSDQKQP